MPQTPELYLFKHLQAGFHDILYTCIVLVSDKELMLYRVLFLFFALKLLSMPVLGLEPDYSPTYRQCLDRSGWVTVAMSECNAQELRYQDRLLNSRYRALISGLNGKKRRELKEAQRLWIRYRDANCGFYNGLTGGTMDIVASGGCYVDMTARRAMELEAFLQLLGV
jgi:uncharacterized protein YecT (DUF1311 family)